MIWQVLLAVALAIVTAVAGYYLGTALRGRLIWYRVIFGAIVVAAVAAIAVSLVGGYDLVAAAAIGSGFGLLNGVRHGFTRPFDGLTGSAGDGE